MNVSQSSQRPCTGYRSSDILTGLSNVCRTLLFLLICILSYHYRFYNFMKTTKSNQSKFYFSWGNVPHFPPKSPETPGLPHSPLGLPPGGWMCDVSFTTQAFGSKSGAHCFDTKGTLLLSPPPLSLLYQSSFLPSFPDISAPRSAQIQNNPDWCQQWALWIYTFTHVNHLIC